MSKDFKFFANDVVNGRIDHVDIGDAVNVFCVYLNDLIELPSWPNVECVNCAYSVNLRTIPDMPKVKLINCCSCLNLTKIGNCPKLTTLLANECGELVDMPKHEIQYVFNLPNYIVLDEPAFVAIVQTDFLMCDMAREIYNWLK